jgi:hypothetical protein
MRAREIDRPPVPKIGQRGIILGKTGSGKSVLAKRMIESYPGLIVIIDPKATFKYRSELVESAEDFKSAEGRVLTVRLDPDIKNQTEEYNKILKEVYYEGNTLLYIDELYGLSENNRTYPSYLNAIYTRGRELNITILAASQRPTWIPLFCLSESEYFYVFQLTMEKDRKRVAEIVSPDFSEASTNYDFRFARSDSSDQKTELLVLKY